MSQYAEHYDILLGQHVTEKSAMCNQNNSQMVFKVKVGATKPQIKSAIQKIYGVKVIKCQVVNRPGKYLARRNGHTKKFRIAYVRVESNQSLNVTE